MAHQVLTEEQQQWYLSGATQTLSRTAQFLNAPVRVARPVPEGTDETVLRALVALLEDGTPTQMALRSLTASLTGPAGTLAGELLSQVQSGATLAQAIGSQPLMFGSTAGAFVHTYATSRPTSAAISALLMRRSTRRRTLLALRRTHQHLSWAIGVVTLLAAGVLMRVSPALADTSRWALASGAAWALAGFSLLATLAPGASVAIAARTRWSWLANLAPLQLRRAARAVDLFDATQVLADLLDEGSPIPVALQTCAGMAEAPALRAALVTAADATWAGSPLADALCATPASAALGRDLRAANTTTAVVSVLRTRQAPQPTYRPTPGLWAAAGAATLTWALLFAALGAVGR